MEIKKKERLWLIRATGESRKQGKHSNSAGGKQSKAKHIHR